MRKTIIRLCVGLCTFLVGISFQMYLADTTTTLSGKPVESVKQPNIVYDLQPKQIYKEEYVYKEEYEEIVNPDALSMPFDPSGDYHPLNEINEHSDRYIQFDLELKRKKSKLFVQGNVKNIYQWYKLTFVSLTEKKLMFRTRKINGVEYRFDGYFLSRGNFRQQVSGRGKVLLRGVLQKFVNGEKVFEVETPFRFYGGC